MAAPGRSVQTRANQQEGGKTAEHWSHLVCAQADALERVFQQKMMSHLRHEILNDFAARIAWHDVVAIATCSAHSRRTSRDFDNVMPREAFYEITRNFVSQSRHRKRFSNRLDAHAD